MCFAGMGPAHQVGKSSTHGALAGGPGLTLGIFVSGKTSGGHLNPAVTTAFAVRGKMGNGILQNLTTACLYIAAQCLGMFTAAVAVYGVYHKAGDAVLTSDATSADLQNMVCLYATCAGEDVLHAAVRTEFCIEF
jgi:glycerol uptake facilitator protein